MTRIIVLEGPTEKHLQNPPLVKTGVQLLRNRRRRAEVAEVADMEIILHRVDHQIAEIPLAEVVGLHLVGDKLLLTPPDNHHLLLLLVAWQLFESRCPIPDLSRTPQ